MFGLMGNCITWGKGKQVARRSVTLLAVGLDNAGKTTTVHGVKGDHNEDVAPTMGFSSLDMRSGKYDVKIFDLGGGARIRGIWQNYMAEAHGVIFVVDSSDMERVEECKDTFGNFVSDMRIRGKPILILANKQDKPEAMDENDLCDRLNLDEVVNANECLSKVVLCSALPLGASKKRKKKPKLDRGIKMGFVWLLDVIGQDFELLDERITRDVEEQRKKDEEERKERIERVRKRREERDRLEAEGEKEQTEKEADVVPNKSSNLSTLHSATESEGDNSFETTQPPNEQSRIIPQAIVENKLSGLGTNLIDDEDSDEDVTKQTSSQPQVLAVGLPGAVNTSNEFVPQPENDHQISVDENRHATWKTNANDEEETPRALSVASLREIVRDTPTPVDVPAVRLWNGAGNGSRTSSPLDHAPATGDGPDNGDRPTPDVDATQQKKKKKKRAKKKNKIDPTLNGHDSENSFHGGSVPGRLTPISKNLDGLPSLPSVLPPLRTAPNFSSDVEL